MSGECKVETMGTEQIMAVNGEEHKEGATSTSAAGSEQVAPTANGGSTANGEKKAGKKEKKVKEKKPETPKKEKTPKEELPKEPPKTLKEDALDWLKHHQGTANHKANYELLAKLVAYVGEDEAKLLQGISAKTDAVSNSQLVAAFADGQLAAKLVKKLSILAPVPSVEGEEEAKKKENQVALLQALVDYAKADGGVAEDKVFAPSEVQEAKKSAYPALFNTLVTLLGAKGVVDVEQLAGDAVKFAVENSISTKVKSTVSGAISHISHSISDLKLSLQRKKSCGNAVENGEKRENGEAECSNAVNGTTTEDTKKEEGKAVAAH